MQRRAHQERTSRELTQGRIARYLVIVSILSSGSLAGRAWAAPSLPEADPAGPAQTDAVWAEPAPRAEQSSLEPAASPDTAEATAPAEVGAPALDWSSSDWALSMLSADLGHKAVASGVAGLLLRAQQAARRGTSVRRHGFAPVSEVLSEHAQSVPRTGSTHHFDGS